MKKIKSIHSQVIIIYAILMLSCLFSIPAFSDTGDKWVSISDAHKQPAQVSTPEWQVIQSDDNYLTIHLKTAGFLAAERQENGRVYTVLHMGKYNADMKPGYPNIPAVRQYIEIPAGKMARLKVIPGSAVTFNNYHIYPVQPPTRHTNHLKNTVEPIFDYDDTVYNLDRLFPSELAYLDKKERLRGHNIALLHICPFQYNPAQKILHAYPNMEVRVTFEGETQTLSARAHSPQFDSFIRGLVMNPGPANTESPGGTVSTISALTKNELAKVNVESEGADFLIITAPEFLSAATALHDHKEALGLNTVVKTTTDTGITGFAIKNYIQNAYDTWSPAPTYILLLGDVVYIPVHYRTPEPVDANYIIGTDLYYACVDGADYQPDIFLGRISVDTLAEAQTVVQKIINYESNPPTTAAFYANAAVVSCFYNSNEEGYEQGRRIRTTEEIRDFLMTRGYNIERIYSRNDSWGNPTHYNNGYYGNRDPLPPDLLIENGFSWDGSTADIISAINSGISLMIHEGQAYESQWPQPEFNEDDIVFLNNGNLLPVIFNNSSNSGLFDHETDQSYNFNNESLCELLLRKSNGGAVAAIGPSRETFAGYGNFMDEGFIDSIWPDFLPEVPNANGASTRLGPMLNHGKIAMDIMWGDPQGFRQAEYESVHLFGDPTLNIWTKQPGSQGTQTIKIQSDPDLSVPITVSQADINGNTDGETFFTRTYPYGAVITITPPDVFYCRSFVKWVVDGTSIENTSIQLTMDQYHQATVFYTDEKILKVTSYPVNGIPITVSPNDNTGSGNGNTNFIRYYATGASVILTAPGGVNGRNFSRWLIDGAPNENRTIQVIMDADHTIKAEFSVLSTDKKILIIDKDMTANAQKIKNAIEANGYNTKYTIITPTELQPELYPAVFITGDSLTPSECAQLTRYLDNGGNLYIGNILYYHSSLQVLLKSHFGIKDIGWNSMHPTQLNGMPGTFTDGFSFTFPENTFTASELEWDEDVTGSFIIWDGMFYSQFYHIGIARDADTFKTIGVGFNFGDLPENQRTAVMEKYLSFFLPDQAEMPTLQIISPNGGENLTPGSIHNITWNAAKITNLLKITLWQDGLLVGVIVDQLAAGRNYYPWEVGKYKGGTVSPGSGYMIKIEEIDTGVCDLSNSTFTISAAASLNVTSPNGAENLTTGATQAITWISTNVGGTLQITLWNNGTQVGVIADELNPSPGTYSWAVGNYTGGVAFPGPGYKIKIIENGTAVSDMSDNAFTILPSPTLTITSPNSSETFLAGAILPITWSADNVSGTLEITLWKDGEQLGTIARGINPAKRRYSWTVGIYEGGVALPGAGYKIKIEDNKSGVSDDSDNSFSIAEQPSLVVKTPNGGDNLSLGTSYNITWKSSNISGTLKISLWQNDALVGVIVDNINPAEVSYQWTVGNYTGGTVSPGTGYKVKVEENGSAAADSSDNSFIISDASSITVVSPNGGENLTIGTTQQITWNAANVKRTLKITLWKGGEQVGVIAGQVDPSRSFFPWKVGSYAGGTAPAGTGYQVKIEDEGTPDSDLSDSAFTLLAVPSITVTSPNGGETLTIGTTHLLTWTSVNISGPLKITLWYENSLSQVIADDLDPAATSYLWTVDSSNEGVLYRVKIEEKGTAISDTSDKDFTIAYPHSLFLYEINTPVANNFIIGQIYSIQWYGVNINRSLKITLWKGGALVGTIADYLDPKVNDYSWKMGTYMGGTVGTGTGYKVKIEEHDTGIYAISAADFTILPVPTITVTSPTGGEMLTKGTPFDITWRASNIPWNLTISLIRNNITEGSIADNINPAATSYQWVVGDLEYGTAPEGANYQIEIRVDGTNIFARSEPYFAIYYPPSLTVITPDGGETWGLHDVKHITWEDVKLGNTLKLSLWKNNTFIGVIADGIDPTADYYSWTVGSYIGGEVSPGTDYQVKIEENGSELSDMSNAPFEITPAHTIQIISPNGGENFQVGTTQTITWTSSNLTNDLKISLWRDGSYWTTIDYVDMGSTSYQWLIEEEIGEGYKIKIEEVETAYSDMSNNWFTISGLYSLRVTAPNGGEQWAQNTVKKITWTSTGLYGSVSIYLFKDGQYVSYISNVDDVTTGYYDWTVDSVPSGPGYKIKIEANSTPYIYDLSNETFTITDD